jgi:uncharacterized protein
MRGVATAAGVLVGAWLLVVLLAWGFQRQLIYLPDRAAPAAPPAAVEEVTFTTADDLELAAWYVPAAGEPAGFVLFTPGNAGNRAHRLPLASGLSARGHAVLLVDYRGYGGNPGSPSEAGLLRDAAAAWAYLEARDDVAAERIVLLGESIGAGVATGLAAELAPTGDPAAVVLRSPFPSLGEVARGHYPFLPVRMLLRDRFPVSEQLTDIDVPILVVAGDADTIVPTALSREVAQRAGARYVELAGVDHNAPALLDGAEFLDAVDDFVRHSLEIGG